MYMDTHLDHAIRDLFLRTLRFVNQTKLYIILNFMKLMYIHSNDRKFCYTMHKLNVCIIITMCSRKDQIPYRCVNISHEKCSKPTINCVYHLIFLKTEMMYKKKQLEKIVSTKLE